MVNIHPLPHERRAIAVKHDRGYYPSTVRWRADYLASDEIGAWKRVDRLRYCACLNGQCTRFVSVVEACMAVCRFCFAGPPAGVGEGGGVLARVFFLWAPLSPPFFPLSLL